MKFTFLLAKLKSLGVASTGWSKGLGKGFVELNHEGHFHLIIHDWNNCKYYNILETCELSLIVGANSNSTDYEVYVIESGPEYSGP